jgi:hypothetical protein
MTENINSTNFAGFYKIWRVHKETGEKELLVDNKNLILYQGADLMALSLGGFKNAKISNMYAGYVNSTAPLTGFTPTVIDKQCSVPFTSYGSGLYSNHGYLRVPLAYAPTYQGSTGDYNSNQVIFTSIIASSQTSSGGAAFSFADAGTPSFIFEIALAAAVNTGSSTNDIIFSRANFTPITYDQNYNLTISWGIQFLA